MRVPDSAYGKKRSACDFLLLHNGLMIGAEAKMITDGSKSFSFSKVSDSQIKGLKKIESEGGKGYILINFRWLGTGNDKGKAFALPYIDFLYLMWAFENDEELSEEYTNDKSIPLDYFYKEVKEVPKLSLEKGYGWDLSVLYE